MVKKPQAIIGLDVSTDTIGVSVFDLQANLIDLTHLKPRPKPKPSTQIEDWLKKAEIFDEFLTRYENYDIYKVIIEEPLINGQNAHTVAVLLRFNAMITEKIYNRFGVVANYISTDDARKNAFPELLTPSRYYANGNFKPIKQRKQPALFGAFPRHWDKKAIILNKVSKRQPEINWVYHDKGAHKGQLRKENYDAADAWTCVVGYMKMQEIW